MCIQNSPMILEDTRSGLRAYSIEDDMLRNRQVCLMGPVNEESVNALVKQLLYLEQSKPGEEITFYINSGGGEVGNGLVLYDVMKYITSPIKTICVGMAASMAAVLFSAGNHRELFRHSRVMIHDPAINGSLRTKALELKSLSEDLMATRESLAEILAANTGQELEVIYEKTAVDSFFDARSAVEFGLADAIIGGEPAAKNKSSRNNTKTKSKKGE